MLGSKPDGSKLILHNKFVENEDSGNPEKALYIDNIKTKERQNLFDFCNIQFQWSGWLGSRKINYSMA